LPTQTTNTYRKGTNSGTPIINKVTYDDYGNILTQTDANTITNSFTYSPTTHLLTNKSEKVNSSVTRNTQYTRNSQGKIIDTTIKDQSGTLLAHTKYENIDTFGNIGKIKIEDDNQNAIYLIEYGYSGAFPIKQSINVTDADQQTSTITSQMEYDSTTGWVTSATDGNTFKTLYQYDKLGRLIKVTHPDQTFATAAYNDSANYVTLTDETKVATRHTWDRLGNKLEEGIIDGSYRMLRRYGYDNLERLISETDAAFRQTTYEYNSWNQLIKTNLPTPTPSSSTVVYDEFNRTKTISDPEGVETRYYYDRLGRETGMGIKKGTQFQTVFSKQYDYEGNVISIAKNTTFSIMTHDALGRVTFTKDAEQNITSYYYSLAGFLKEVRYPDGKSVYKQADQLGRIIKSTDPNGKVDWATLGTFDSVKGTFAPEKPLSLQHWVDSASTAFLIFGFGKGVSSGAANSTYKAVKAGALTGSVDGLTAAEKTVINDLLSQGKNVSVIPRSTTSKTPDFLINGIKTELKTLSNANVNTAITRIQDGFKQGAQTVIIDARGTSMTSDQVAQIMSRAAGTYKDKALPGKVEIWIK